MSVSTNKRLIKKFTLEHGMKAQRGSRGIHSYTLSLTSALMWPTPRHGRCTSVKKDPEPVVRETGWSKEPVWTSAENLAPTGTRSPDRPSRSEYLYRQRYPGPHKQLIRFPNSFGFAWKVLRDVFSFQIPPRATWRSQASKFQRTYLLLSPLHLYQRTAVVLRRAILSVLKSAEIQWYVTVARIEGEVWHGQSIKVGATARRHAHLSLVATLVLRVAPGPQALARSGNTTTSLQKYRLITSDSSWIR